MADAIYDITEIRFVIEPELTQVYMLAENVGNPTDMPIGVVGWHHKTFPKSMSTLDIMNAWARGEETPIMWPLDAPKATR